MSFSRFAAAAVVVAAAFLTAPAAAMEATAMICEDKAYCASRTCHNATVASDKCVVLPYKDHGIEWNCHQLAFKPCFLLRGYPAGSNCRGRPVATRANFCDECKGQDPKDYVNMQHRKCEFFPGTQNVVKVGYHNCGREAVNGTCVDCNQTAAVSFSAGVCTPFQGREWRLEMSSDACPMMHHVNFYDKACTKVWWSDYIVLNECNGGWQFVCPNVPVTKWRRHV